jgi:hypothetical protein
VNALVSMKYIITLCQIWTFKDGFLILTLFWSILSIRQIRIYQHEILDFFHTQYDLFPGQLLSSLKGTIFQIFGHRTDEYIEKCLF